MLKNNKIEKSKKTFNKFFKDDLYGRFDNDENIILSRGGWNDNYVTLPRILKFCVDYTIKKHWTGYSDSLGHRNTIKALVELTNVQPISKKYTFENVAITLGNVVTIGFVFRQLKNIIPNAKVVTLSPYYSPIIKSINFYFKKISFLSSLQEEENLLSQIKQALTIKNNKILFLSNSIGVESRVFSKKFWQEIINIINKKNVYLVIDEGVWFKQLEYGKDINNDHIIRIVSLSKKYGLPGCKLGYMLASKKFIKQFYDYASTNYGGPLSFFFLLSEFIYQFEFIYHSKIKPEVGLKPLFLHYNISMKKLVPLYNDFVYTVDDNFKKFNNNLAIITKWAKCNEKSIKNFYNFNGINVFIEPKIKLRSYKIFLKSINQEGVSIMPSSCFGDFSDSMFRITLLEKTADLKRGLNKFKKIIE